MANSINITHEIDILFNTKLDKKHQEKVGQQIRDMLDNAVISFDEADAKSQIQSIVRMMEQLFAKAEIAFDADKLLGKNSMDALRDLAAISADQFQDAFNKALAKSGGVKIDFGGMDLSSVTEPLERVANELTDITKKLSDTTKKSVDDIDKSLKKLKPAALEKTVSGIDKLLGNLNKTNFTSLSTDTTKVVDKLSRLRENYSKAVKGGAPWEKQYSSLVTFVATFEQAKRKFGEGLFDDNPEIKDLYNLLSPKFNSAKMALADFSSLAKGGEMSEYKNQPWAREKTLTEIRDVLRGGISVKDGSSNPQPEDPPKEPSREPKSDDGKTKVSPSNSADASSTERPQKEAIADTSAFNQKLFDAIDKLSKDFEAAFKLMRNGDLDEDSLDDKLSDLRGEFLKQFKFDGKQRIDDYLAEKSDDMGEWNNKKIYDKLSKKLSPNDPSWPRIEEPIADSADTSVISEQNDELKKQAEIIELINSLISSKSQKEKFAYLNMQTGDASKYIEGEYDGVPVDKIKQLGKSDGRDFNSTLHTHPTKVAVPSPEDFTSLYVKNFEIFKKNFILATDEIAEIDFSQLTERQVKNISDEYEKRVDSKASESLSLQDLGINSIDIESTWGELEKQLNTVFPALSSAIRSYVEDLRQAIFADGAVNMPVEDVWDVLNDKASGHFPNRDVEADVSGIAEKVFNQTTGEFDAIQRVYRDILIQTIKDFGYDVSQIFKTYNVRDFVQQFQPQAETTVDIEPKPAHTPSEKPAGGTDGGKVSVDVTELKGVLDSITYNVKVVQGENEPKITPTQTDGQQGVAINEEQLRGVLGAITYNVKVVADTDAEPNRIAVDAAELKSVLHDGTPYDIKNVGEESQTINIDETALNNALSNISQAIQSTSSDENVPWAREDTLKTTNTKLDSIKGVLDNIATHGATQPVSDVGNVLATETTLDAIKRAVESIDSKVVEGTEATTSDGSKTSVGKKNAESYDDSRYFPEKLKTQTMQLAKFRAQLMTTGKLTDDVDAQIYELLDGLKQVQNGPDFSVWTQKFQQLKTSVGITDIFDKADGKAESASYQQLIEYQKLRNKLELEYEKAQDGSALKTFYAEQLAQMDGVITRQQEMLDNEEYEAKLAKLREEQERKLGALEAKAADKATKDAEKRAIQLSRKQAMSGKAGSAVGRAESTWLGALSLDNYDVLPEDFKAKMTAYHNELEKLRSEQFAIAHSDGVVSDEHQAELIRHTQEVNKLTDEYSQLIAEYNKLSGSNVAENLGISTLDPNASVTDYEKALKQAVNTTFNGKAQIKDFNNETKTLTYTLKTGKNEFTTYTAAVRHLDGQMVSVAGNTKRAETFFEASTRKLKEISSYVSAMSIFSRVSQEVRRGLQYVKEIDSAMTELKKVTDETEETYDKFLDTASKTAAKVGSTVKEIISSTADWARLKYLGLLYGDI